MKHHPDRGGDEKTFQSISQAYDTLGDAAKRQQYDNERLNRPFIHVRSGFNDFNDIFGQFGFGGGNQWDPFQRQARKNRDLNINCTVSFKDSFLGKQLEASYILPSGKKQTVVINAVSYTHLTLPTKRIV